LLIQRELNIQAGIEKLMDMHNYLKKTERLGNQIFSPEIQGYWEALKSVALAQETKEIYLVGGVLRDLLLDRPIQDFDIAVKGEARTIASLFAHKIKGHFVVLDEAWETYRVIKGKCIFDFNPFRGPDILSDLIERDFTVNTLALNIFYPKTVLDPFLGRLDIQKRILRMVSHKVFWKDALRILRGLRLAAELDFKLEDETRRLMKRYAPLLKKIPAERIYQEIKRLFFTPRAITQVREMGNLGIFKAILPEIEKLRGVTQDGYHHLDVYSHSLLTFEEIEKLINYPSGILSDFKKDIVSYVKQPFHRFCLKWAALCHDLGKPSCRAQGEGRITFYGHNKKGASLFTSIANRLRFPHKEAELITFFILQHMWPFHLVSLYLKEELTLRAIYRLIRKAEPHTIGLFLLAMADNLAAQGSEKTPYYNQQFCALFKKIMEIRAQYLQFKQRPRLVTGNDILEWFNLKPGPIIGELLKEIEEAQLVEKIKTKKDAHLWLEQYLKKQ